MEDDPGPSLGAVADILKTGAGADVLVVRGPKGESLVPLVVVVHQARSTFGGGRLVAAPPELIDVAG